MREYETTFIVQPEISEEGTRTILAKLDGILESGGATRLWCEDWGKRKLAFEIEKFHKGHYYTLNYLDEGRVVSDLERSLRMEESVLRFLTILAEPEVEDVEARKADAAEKERDQSKRAAERAAREAEEAAARREAEQQAAAEEAERGSSGDDSAEDGDSRPRAAAAGEGDGSSAETRSADEGERTGEGEAS